MTKAGKMATVAKVERGAEAASAKKEMEAVNVKKEMEAANAAGAVNAVKAIKLEALAARKIFSYLDDAHGITSEQIHIAKQLTSTNSWLMQAVRQGKQYRACLAELQTAGRGTHNRVWHSGDPGTNIYLSFSYPLGDQLGEHWSGLTLVLGIAAVSALKSFGVQHPLLLKWPNDIYLNGGKLGGILVETVSHQGVQYAVVGLGLNLLPPLNCTSRYACLQEVMQVDELVPRNQLVGYLLDQMLAACDQYALYGFAPWKDSWNGLDYTAMRKICVRDRTAKETGAVRSKELSGRGLGVDNRGHLLVSLNETQVVSVATGEVVLHEEKEEGVDGDAAVLA